MSRKQLGKMKDIKIIISNLMYRAITCPSGESINDLEATDGKGKTVWQLDDTTKYVCLGIFDYPKAMTNSINKDDPDTLPERREYIRKQAATKISQTRVNEVKQQVKWWAFRIFIKKKLVGKKRFDLDNATKLVADTFSEDTVRKDQSLYGYLALYEDDKLPFVRVIVVMGQPSGPDHTNVEIFGSLVS